MGREVKSIDELKDAIRSGETEIISFNDDVVKKIKAVKLAKSLGPATVGGIIATIPLILATGPLGAGAVSLLAPSAGITTSVIVALVVAIGGTIAISLFTDWEYAEISPGGIKMSRKKNTKFNSC